MGLLFGLKRLLVRVPKVGDKVWWAPKQAEGVVEYVAPRYFRFTAGPIVKRRKKTEQAPERFGPQWIVGATYDAARYDESLKTWIVGEGPTPRVNRGVVLTPEPAVMRFGAN